MGVDLECVGRLVQVAVGQCVAIEGYAGAQGRLKVKHADLVEALEGRLGEEDRWALK